MKNAVETHVTKGKILSELLHHTRTKAISIDRKYCKYSCSCLQVSGNINNIFR